MELLSDPEVAKGLSPNYAAIKVKAGTQSCAQFSQIYPVILVPSIYFIDSATGVDLEVIGGPNITKETLLASISKVVQAKKASEASNPQLASADPISDADSVASPRGVRVEQARRMLQDSVGPGTSQGQSGDSDKQETKLSLEERVARAKRLLALRKAKDEDEKAEASYSLSF